jgi:hypothetical protein
MAEIVNNKADIKRIFFLPNVSDKNPANATPIMQPNKADPTNQPSIATFIMNYVFTKPIVPEITAVS